MSKLGLIAGGGGLPLEILRSCAAAERPVYVVRLRGFAETALAAYDGFDAGIAELGKIFKALKSAHCEAVCFAGLVNRPDFAALRPDMKGLAAMPGAVAAATKGDDALLRYMVRQFEKEGFLVEGADQIVRGLTIDEGPIGRHAPKPDDILDIETAMRAARTLGELDIGQGAVSVRGLILALEAQEGTDAMLRRCADLPPALRGTSKHPIGVLAKAPKPIQDRRIDLPTIGPATVKAASAAGLAGIVGEAGGLLIVDKVAILAAADELGLFIVGLPQARTP
jgi:DUF1009 family protein